MYTINEILTTKQGEIIAKITSTANTKEKAHKKVLDIHERNEKMGLRDGVTYLVELIEP